MAQLKFHVICIGYTVSPHYLLFAVLPARTVWSIGFMLLHGLYTGYNCTRQPLLDIKCTGRFCLKLIDNDHLTLN